MVIVITACVATVVYNIEVQSQELFFMKSIPDLLKMNCPEKRWIKYLFLVIMIFLSILAIGLDYARIFNSIITKHIIWQVGLLVVFTLWGFTVELF